MSKGLIHAALEGQKDYAGKAYFFHGDQYVRYDWTLDRAEDGYPMMLTSWGLPVLFASGIQAALNGQGPYDGKAYFFKGTKYIRYDWANDQIDGATADLSAWHLPGSFATGFDAALNGQGSYAGKAYL